MAVDDHSLNRAARVVCRARSRKVSAVKSSKRTKQGEAGLRKGDWARAYRKCDRRRADEEAKHDGDRSRVCDVREPCASVSSGKTSKASPIGKRRFWRRKTTNEWANQMNKSKGIRRHSPRVEKIVFCLTGPYLSRRATLVRAASTPPSLAEGGSLIPPTCHPHKNNGQYGLGFINKMTPLPPLSRHLEPPFSVGGCRTPWPTLAGDRE